MKVLGFAFYCLLRALYDWWDRRRSLQSHINRLRKSGYTKIIFDQDGHTIVIQSYKHVCDRRA